MRRRVIARLRRISRLPRLGGAGADAPHAIITFNQSDADAGIITLYGNSSTISGTPLWTVTGPPGFSSYSWNGHSFSSQWTGTNPCTNGNLDPASFDQPTINGVDLYGGGCITLRIGSRTARKYFSMGNDGNNDVRFSDTQKLGTIGGVGANSIASDGAQSVDVSDITINGNVTENGVFWVTLFSVLDAFTTPGGHDSKSLDCTGAGGQAVSVFAYPYAMGRNGGPVQVATPFIPPPPPSPPPPPPPPETPPPP